jgi:hypothetical protein
MTLSIKDYLNLQHKANQTISINDTAKQPCSFMLGVVMLNVVKTNAVVLNVVSVRASAPQGKALGFVSFSYSKMTF